MPKKKKMDTENKVKKEPWQCPKLYSLNLNKTDGGNVIDNTEDLTYHLDS